MKKQIGKKQCHRTFQEISVSTLKKAGFRITKQRLAVIECLGSKKQALTASALFDLLSSHSNGAPLDKVPLDKVSVYRVLDTLLELNLVHRVPPNGAYLACIHQDCTDSHHVISLCTECKSVKEVDIPNEVVAPLLFHMKNSLDFTPDSHLLHMEGVCVECSE